jgi:hypothetical protein
MHRSIAATACAIGAIFVLPCMVTGAPDYPRIANLWGCGPTATEYEQWAKYDLLVMAGGGPDAHRRFRREIEARNGDALLLGTAPLMNIGPPGSSPWMKDEWYLCRPDGQKINWWAGQIYAPNLTIDECLEALLQRTDEPYGELLSEGAIDGVFYDSVVGRATWYGEVDTDRDGQADTPAEIDPQWHARQCLFFDRLRERWPKMLILANDVDTGHAPHLHGRLYEGGALLDRVATGHTGAQQAVATLADWMTGSLQPAITFAIMTHPLGWQGWRVGRGREVTTPGEVDRVRRDYQRMRGGLATALMSDAYYAYDFGTVWYGLPLWYAEYDAPLGQALSAAEERFKAPPLPVLEWRAGEATGIFALDEGTQATPEGVRARVTEGGGWRRLLGTDPATVHLEPGKSYRIRAECEVLEKPTQMLQFNVRTGRGGWEHHDKGVVQNAGDAGQGWDIDVTVVPDDFDDYAIEWHLLGEGSLLVRSLRVELVGESCMSRQFEGGIALLNPTPYPVTVELEQPMRRLKDDAAPLHALEIDDGATGFSCEGAWEVLGGEGHHTGSTYRRALKPGAIARWVFAAPAADRYTLFACVPGGKEASDAALYKMAGPAEGPAKVLDQRQGDGGWVELLQVDLAEGEACEVLLQSGGTGATIADALRVESRSRLNDGSLVERITLAPNDGTILLRNQ